MLLNQIGAESNHLPARNRLGTEDFSQAWRDSAGSESEFRRRRYFVGRFVVRRAAMRATGAAFLGAGAERFIDDRLDRTRATSTLGAAAEASVNLLGIPRKIRSCTHGIPDIVVGQDVAGTDDHEK